MPSSRTAKMVGTAPAEAIAGILAAWFSRSHRALPWRETSDPYAIWVSEIMLQQTRADTVTRYWSEFLRRFPTVQRLAAADESEVLEAWSGLGYYRRARLLHRGAQFVADECGGRLPRDVDGLQSVPGIGRYTAGALATIAFDTAAPMVDGNVARVLSRLDAVEDPLRQPATAAAHWPRAAQIIGAAKPAVVAQALMELGATVCTPKSPRCETCPLTEHCRARAKGLVAQIPSPIKRAPSPVTEYWALAITWRGKLGLVQRPETGLLAGLWCLPLVPRETLPTPSPEALAELLAVPIRNVVATADAVKHVFTHRVWQMQPVVATATRKPKSLPGGAMVWCAAGERPRGGMPTVTEKLLVATDEVR